MLAKTGEAITFTVLYTTSGLGTTGLTVTVDVFRDTTSLVTAAAATEIGDGLYRYTLSSGSTGTAGAYSAVFKTSTSTVDTRHIAALWIVGQPWVQTLLADIWSYATRTLTSFGTLAYDIWAYSIRTLTMTASQLASVIEGDEITIQRGDTLSVSITGLGDISNRTKLWFALKVSKDDLDSESIVFIEETDGLTYFGGASEATAAKGSLVVDDEVTGAVTITLDESRTVYLINDDELFWDIQVLRDTSVCTTLTEGTATINYDVVRAIS